MRRQWHFSKAAYM